MAITHSVKVDSKGRLSIPQSLRRELNIEPGDTLFVETEGDQVLRYAKATNPFDELAAYAGRERTEGRTRGLRDIAADYDDDASNG